MKLSNLIKRLSFFLLVMQGLLFAVSIVITNYYYKSYQLNEIQDKISNIDKKSYDSLVVSILNDDSTSRDYILYGLLESLQVDKSNFIKKVPKDLGTCQKVGLSKVCNQNSLWQSFIPIQYENKTYGYVALEKMFNSSPVSFNLVWIVGLILFLAFTLNFLAFYFFNKKYVQNEIQKLHQAVSDSNIESDSFSFKIFEIKQLLSKFKNNLKQVKKANSEKDKREMALKVAHDIRSPLIVLEAATENLNDESSSRIIKNATAEISEILSKLLQQEKIDKELKETHILHVLIDIINNKKLEYSNDLKIELKNTPESYDAFSNLQASELKMILSNLINNGIEASEPDSVKIGLELDLKDDFISIIVTDKGKGVPEEILDKLGSKKISSKSHGNGIGFYNARKYLEEIGGKLKIKSMTGFGTKVTILVPKSSTPAWFAQNLRINENVFLADDSNETLNFWEKIVRTHRDDVKVKRTNIPFIPNDEISNRTCLVDYDFGEETNGIEVIQNLKNDEQSYLVTGNFDSIDLLKDCIEKGIKIIPKNLIELIPVRYN